jgi:hypothetical protein
MTRKAAAHAAAFTAVIGATGAGKTEYIRQQLARSKPKRLIVWDFKPISEYGHLGETFTDRAALVEAALAAGSGPFRAIYRPGTQASEWVDKFDWLCRFAYAFKHCTLIAEELAHVTRAGWSPDGWKLVVTMGRSEGLTVYGATQRPALVDKTFISAASLIHCGRLGARSDRVTMADLLDCDPKELAALRPMDWIERRDSGETARGSLTYIGPTSL